MSKLSLIGVIAMITILVGFASVTVAAEGAKDQGRTELNRDLDGDVKNDSEIALQRSRGQADGVEAGTTGSEPQASSATPRASREIAEKRGRQSRRGNTILQSGEAQFGWGHKRGDSTSNDDEGSSKKKKKKKKNDEDSDEDEGPETSVMN